MRARILLVDDEPDILTTMSDALRIFLSPDLEVDTAVSGDEARSKVEENDYDLVISDERLPGLRGLDLLEWMRHEKPKPLRVLMTAYNEAGMRERAFQRAKVHLLVAKPFDFAKFASDLRRLLEARVAAV